MSDPNDLSDETAAARWWWDLRAGRAVRDDERSSDKDVLGPYPTREAAEAWRQSHEAREEAWDDEDERWLGKEGEEGEQGDGAS